GHGLGLAIAKEIVELHKGEIAAASTVGTGTVFTITFPSDLS
ncbi:MAG: hybrid sensor histidine kinase/response regulator, partial [Bacteroidota bacterium]|nr:hybrid sensor histidine kinase/response regulator [Bacteroidota bacterium]